MKPFKYWVYWGVISGAIGLCLINLTSNFIFGSVVAIGLIVFLNPERFG